jgi:hypothetical protein
LQHHGNPSADSGGADASGRALAQQAPRPRSLTAFNAGPHHADRPEQERDAARKVQQQEDIVALPSDEIGLAPEALSIGPRQRQQAVTESAMNDRPERHLRMATQTA